MSEKLVAVIFVKQSRRFPGKHSAMIGERSLLDTVAEKVTSSKQFGRVIILSKDPRVKSGICDVVQDNTDGTILNSLRFALASYGNVFAFAGDMPCITSSIFRRELSMFENKAVVPRRPDGTLETLHAIYPSLTTSYIDANLMAHRFGLRDLVEIIPHVLYPVPPDEEANFLNVNTPSDLELVIENGCGKHPLKTRKW